MRQCLYPILIRRTLAILCFSLVGKINAHDPIKTLHEIDSLGQIIYTAVNDSIRLEANKVLSEQLFQILSTEASLRFPFDSLKFIKTLISSDRSVKLLTWVVPLESQQYRYFGFIQLSGTKSPFKVIELRDNGGLRDPFLSYTPENWPGAVYYKLIEKQLHRKTFYTMFGWIGTRNGIASRILETMLIDEESNISFGIPVFQSGREKQQHRVIFEFTDKIPFHLAYEEHILPGHKRKKSWMIIHNRLDSNRTRTPGDPVSGIPRYDAFDGYVYRKGYWHQISDIDARAKVSPTPPPSRTGLFPDRDR